MDNDSIINIMNDLLSITNYTDDMLFERNFECDIVEEKQKFSLCSNCTNISVVDGYKICKTCGKIVSREIEMGKNIFEQNNGYKLVSTTLMPAKNMGNIGCTKMNNFSSNNFDVSKDARNAYEATRKIHEICQSAKFSKKTEDLACINYMNLKNHINSNSKKSLNNKKSQPRREKKKDCIIAVCIRQACISNKTLFNNKEFAKICNIEPKELTKGNKIYAKLTHTINTEFKPKRITPKDFIPILCQSLLMDESYANEALKIERNISKLYLCSNFVPPTISPAIVLLIINKYKLPISLKTLSNYASSSPTTINKCYKRILPYFEILLDDDKTDRIYKLLYPQDSRPSSFVKMYENLKNIS